MDIHAKPTVVLIQCNRSKIPSYFTKNSDERIYIASVPRTLLLPRTHVLLVEPEVFFSQYDLSKEFDIAIKDAKALIFKILVRRSLEKEKKPVVVFTEDYFLRPLKAQLQKGCRNVAGFTLLHVQNVAPADALYHTISVTSDADMEYVNHSLYSLLMAQ